MSLLCSTVRHVFSFTRYWNSLNLKKVTRDKHPSLFRSSVSDEEKSFVKLEPGDLSGDLIGVAALDKSLGESCYQRYKTYFHVIEAPAQ